MGGRGSGGGRLGGGGGGSSQILLPNETINKYSIDNRGFVSDIKNKLSNMSDLQLNMQYYATKKQLQKANKDLKTEQSKLEKIMKEFDKTQEGTKEYRQKMKEMDTQINNVQIARQWAGLREQTHYLVVNEKFNVRGHEK